jgi:hypothetical protein
MKNTIFSTPDVYNYFVWTWSGKVVTFPVIVRIYAKICVTSTISNVLVANWLQIGVPRSKEQHLLRVAARYSYDCYIITFDVQFPFFSITYYEYISTAILNSHRRVSVMEREYDTWLHTIDRGCVIFRWNTCYVIVHCSLSPSNYIFKHNFKCVYLFTGISFNNTASNSDHTAWNDWVMVNDELEICGRKWSCLKLVRQPGICLKERK